MGSAEPCKYDEDTRRVEPLLVETEELIRIFGASIRTARARKAKK